ncbi:MAG: hypothetical protein AAF501_01500 [Pseudomonadota bacterium]
MALSDIPKFQAAISEDAGLQDKMKSVIKTMTAGIGMPLNAESNVDWTPLTDLAKGLGFEFSADEIKEAIFGNGRELSEDELDAAVGAGGLFSLASFGGMKAVLNTPGGLGDDTIHGVTKGGLGADTIHGVTKGGGIKSDTIHGKR